MENGARVRGSLWKRRSEKNAHRAPYLHPAPVNRRKQTNGRCDRKRPFDFDDGRVPCRIFGVFAAPPARCLLTPLGAKDVAAALNVSERTARRLMRSGELMALKVGKQWRTTEGALVAYLARGFERYRREPKRAA